MTLADYPRLRKKFENQVREQVAEHPRYVAAVKFKPTGDRFMNRMNEEQPLRQRCFDPKEVIDIFIETVMERGSAAIEAFVISDDLRGADQGKVETWREFERAGMLAFMHERKMEDEAFDQFRKSLRAEDFQKQHEKEAGAAK